MNEGSEFRSFFGKSLIIILVVLIILVVGGASMLGILAVVNKVSIGDLLKGESIESGQQTGHNRGTLLNDLDDAISGVVEEITPSVVHIDVTVIGQDILGQTQEQEGLGSGVIYTEDGYIITNNHVAGNAEKLLVTLYDGSEYPAILIGADERNDVAVIKIEAKGLRAASFDSMDDVKVGDIVIAVGSPYGLDQTVTLGVVSAKGRDITIPVNLIQTDAAINPGNSGGPLVNSGGEVIGINTLAATGTSIGFAVPSNTVIGIAKQIIEFGKARIPYMGIEMSESTGSISGVYIIDVRENYPAEESGIRPGDIIVEIDNVKVSNPYELFAQIIRHNTGDEVTVKIYRNGEYLTITLVLVEAPED